MNLLIYAAVILALVGIVVTIIQGYRFFGAVREPGAPRIWFLSLVTLKLWIAFFLGYLLLNTTPWPVPRPWRNPIVLGLAVYLVAQSVGVNIAFMRWWRRRRREAADEAAQKAAGC